MINDNIYSKFTPSAKEAINELTEEYRDSLIEKAYSIAEERETGNREISLRDVLEAKQQPKQLLDKAKYFDYKKKRWAMLISFSGAIYAVAGIIIYLIQNNKFSIENDLGLIIAIIGVLFSLIAFIFGQLTSNRMYLTNTILTKLTKRSQDNFEIVKRWQIIESLAKKIMTEVDQNDPKSSSISFLIRFLSHKIANDEKEFLKIRELLQVRNKILHEDYALNDVERLKFIEFADELIQRLELAQSNEGQHENTLKIIKATYGTDKNSLDATKELNQLVKSNRLEFIVNNEIVGDPEFGVVKKLSITYEINGEIQDKVYNEGDKVIIEN